MDYLLFIAMLIIGIAMIAKPEVLWQVEHFLDVKGGEPTDFYLVSTRVGGVFVTLAAIVFLVLRMMMV